MKAYFSENKQFLALCLVWLMAGILFKPAALILIPLTVLLMYKKEMEIEILVGLVYVLTMSDSRFNNMTWAADAKNIYIVLFSLIVFKNYSKIPAKIKWHQYLFPFILIASFCLIYSPTPILAAQKTLSYFLLFYSVPNYFSYLYSKYGSRLVKDLVMFVFILLLTGLLLKYITPGVTSLAGRYRGVLGNPNGLGIYTFLFITFFAIVIEFFPALFNKRETIFIYVVAGLSLLLCGARSSLLSVIIFYSFRYFNKLSPFVGFMLIILLAGTYELITTNIEAIVYALGLEEYARVETLKDGSGRLIAWNFAWENINKSLFLGKGFNFTEWLYKENYEYLSKLGHQGSAHNSYLTFWLDTGLIGLLSFLTGFLLFIFSISKLSYSVFPLLYAALFSSQFESWLTASLNPFTILLLISFSLILVAGTEKKLETQAAEDNSLTTVAI